MTEDSYILHVHRIVGQPGAPVVFMQHGLEDSSATWVLAGICFLIRRFLAELHGVSNAYGPMPRTMV